MATFSCRPLPKQVLKNKGAGQCPEQYIAEFDTTKSSATEKQIVQEIVNENERKQNKDSNMDIKSNYVT